jgi:thiamine monophosphate kinase
MDEFTLIDQLVEALNGQDRGPAVFCWAPAMMRAAARCRRASSWLASIDNLVADVHFPQSAPPLLIGYRAMMVSLSDLAAMGARPSCTHWWG